MIPDHKERIFLTLDRDLAAKLRAAADFYRVRHSTIAAIALRHLLNDPRFYDLKGREVRHAAHAHAAPLKL